MAKSFGLNPDHVDTCVLGDNEVKAMLEIHIEQGAVLENNQIPVGIVEAISGMKTVRVVVEGVSNHAGATPMNMRKDPAVGSARIISEIERIASTKTLDSTVATVGRIICEPNVPNVIPGRVEFTVDIRDVKQKGINMTMELMKKAIFAVAKASGLSIRTELIGESESITLSESVLSSIEEATKELHVPYMRMNSGAVHDAAMLAGLTDVGMIFIPSRNGRSHVPEEFSDYGDIKTGCDLLLQTILKVAD
jgi:hydantoinase/carbamoylase family amidase